MLKISAYIGILMFLCVSLPPSLIAQVSISTDNSQPDPSAMLEIKSTVKGMLIPRMSTAQRVAIESPAAGLMVYDTDTQSFWFSNSSMEWTNISSGSTGWSLNGNIAGTSDFIGTTNYQSLLLKADNQQAGLIDLQLYNTFWGAGAGASNSSGLLNTAIGQNALAANTNGSLNTASGQNALRSNQSGVNNMACGTSALFSNIGGAANTAAGSSSLLSNTQGSSNTAVGISALQSNMTGSSNTAVGSSSLYSNIDGYNNTAIGTNADVTTGSLFNATAVGANAIVSASNSLVLGDNANVGIGTSAPTAKLEVAGQVKITGGSPGEGKVLTSDANGLAYWTAAGTHAIGENYGGGIVFWVYDGGRHGLIASTADQSEGVRWNAGTNTYTMALSDGLIAGRTNTNIIIASEGYGDGGNYAARTANEFTGIMDGNNISDWYLPSKYELNLLYNQRNIVGGFSNDLYWSSSEASISQAWDQSFTTGSQAADAKTNASRVRAVRSF